MDATTPLPKCKDLKNIPEHQELFTITMEECAEVIQQCSKMIRFGGNTNRFHLEAEIGDLLAMFDLMHEYDIIDLDNMETRKQQKRSKLKVYSHLKV